MSRVGKMPIAVPQGVDVSITAEQIVVKGANGTLQRGVNKLVKVERDGAQLKITPADDSAEANAMSDISDILYVGRSRGHWLLSPYYSLLRWRWLNQKFDYYVEGKVKQAGANLVENVGPLRSLRDRYGHKLVQYNANTHKSKIEAHMPPLG